MKKLLIVLSLFFTCMGTMQAQSPQTKQYEATWESLQARPYPQWFKDAKLGIFIHWGLYSVPAYGGKESYGEWYLRGLQVKDSLRTAFMKNNYGKDFTYRDFAPLFKAELFRPNEWAQLFRDAGARYVVMVSKHHDGYCLWPSKQAKGWNSVDVGPHRDLVGDLTKAVREEGLKMGLYYSLPEWNNPLFRWYTDPNDKVKKYVDEYMLPQFKDLIHTYKPTVVFTDGEWFHKADDWHARELISELYNTVGDEAIVNNRWGAGSDIGFLTPEYSAGITSIDRPWAECRGLGRSFGLNRNEDLDSYMSPLSLIHFFAKAVGNGGGMLLNVGPQSDGQIPLLQQERLIQLGKWLKINGEGIYSTQAWRKKHGQFREVTMERIDSQVDFDWARNTPGKPISEDNFKVDWNGYIQAPSNGVYRFEAEADDGVRVWINDQLVINNWKDAESGAEGNVMGNKTSVLKDGKLRLKAGRKYSIRVSYYEKRRNAAISLFWSSKKMEREVIPQSALFTSVDQTSGNGLKGVYRSQYQYLCYTVKNKNLYAISLEWPGDELVLEVPRPSADAKVSLLGLPGTLPWTYKEGKLVVNLRKVGYNQMPCQYAWTFRITGIPGL